MQPLFPHTHEPCRYCVPPIFPIGKFLPILPVRRCCLLLPQPSNGVWPLSDQFPAVNPPTWFVRQQSRYQLHGADERRQAACSVRFPVPIYIAIPAANVLQENLAPQLVGKTNVPEQNREARHIDGVALKSIMPADDAERQPCTPIATPLHAAHRHANSASA